MVGIHGFHMPLKLRKKSGGLMDINANITGTVSLEAEKKGINMSRIIVRPIRTRTQSLISTSCVRSSISTRRTWTVLMLISLCLSTTTSGRQALRTTKEDGTKEGGWQYYQVSFDVDLDKRGKYRKYVVGLRL